MFVQLDFSCRRRRRWRWAVPLVLAALLLALPQLAALRPAALARVDRVVGRHYMTRLDALQQENFTLHQQLAQSAAACCTPPSGITPTSGAIWPGWSAPNIPPTGFCCAGGSFLCCAVLKVPFITLKNPPPSIKVQIIVLPVWYNKSMESKTGHRKAVSTMTQQFRYVGGHIEVFTENGEFLFSADTMQEAWEELSA